MNFFFQNYPQSEYPFGRYTRYDQAYARLEDLFVFLGHSERKNLELLKSFSTFSFYKKQTVLLQAGEVANKLYFIVSGAIRVYTNAEGNEEQTVLLLTEGNLITSLDGFLTNSLSTVNIVTAEDTYVIEFAYNEFQRLTEKIEGLMFVMLNAFSKALIFQQKHIEVLKADSTAKYKYLQNYANIIHTRFQLRHQASFLGIKPETLSRIRAIQTSKDAMA